MPRKSAAAQHLDQIKQQIKYLLRDVEAFDADRQVGLIVAGGARGRSEAYQRYWLIQQQLYDLSDRFDKFRPPSEQKLIESKPKPTPVQLEIEWKA